jgi:hypothetical protein
LIDMIKKIIEADPEIENESMLVCLDNLASSSIEIFVCYYTLSDYTMTMLAKERINFEILKAAEVAGVSIACPAAGVLPGR